MTHFDFGVNVTCQILGITRELQANLPELINETIMSQRNDTR